VARLVNAVNDGIAGSSDEGISRNYITHHAEEIEDRAIHPPPVWRE
jgi:hypothetical protein